MTTTKDDWPASPHPSEAQQPEDKHLTGRQTYNIVSDLAGGPNVRLKDNVVQGLAILACVIIGVIVGAIVTRDRMAGALVGALVGMIAGLFLSGLGLMIYRAVMHARGKHD